MILNDSRLQVLASIVPVSLSQILKLSQLYLSAHHIANSRVTSIKSLPKAFSVVALVNHCRPIKYLQCTDRMWVNCKLQRQCPQMPLPPFLVPVPSLGHGNYRFGLAGTPSQPSAPKVTPSLNLSTTTPKLQSSCTLSLTVHVCCRISQSFVHPADFLQISWNRVQIFTSRFQQPSPYLLSTSGVPPPTRSTQWLPRTPSSPRATSVLTALLLRLRRSC